MAGFVDKAGKRHQRRFDTMVEAGRWLYEMRHQDESGDGIDAEDTTVDEWFTFWYTELIKDLAANTRRNYAELETGLRTGEMIALTWDDVDWARRTLTIRKTMEFRYK